MSKLNICERFHKTNENIIKYHFGRWGHFVGKHPGLTFVSSFIILFLLITGFIFVDSYSDTLFSWVPSNGWVYESRKKADTAYLATYNSVSFILKTKQTNLLTLSSFNEILILTNEI